MQSSQRPSFGQRANARAQRPAGRGSRPVRRGGRSEKSQLPAIVIGISLSLLLLGGVAFMMTRGQTGGTTTVMQERVGATSSDPNVARLMRDLNEKSRSKRKAAAEDLAAMGTRARDAVPALIEAMHRKGVEVEVMMAARGALKAMGEAAIPDYIDLLGAENPTHRFGAAEALGYHGAKAAPAVEALIEVLKNDEDMDVRLSAAATLGLIGAEATAALPALRKAVGNSNQSFSADPERAELRARAQAAINQITMDE